MTPPPPQTPQNYYGGPPEPRRPDVGSFRSHPYVASVAANSRSLFPIADDDDGMADVHRPPGSFKRPRLDSSSGGDGFYAYTLGAGDNEPPSPHDRARQRTGQACDRCKMRKIKCDDGPGPCETCVRQGEACLVTDRNTRKAHPRGHAQRLENDNEGLHRRVTDAEVDNSLLRRQMAQLRQTVSRLQQDLDTVERENIRLKGNASARTSAEAEEIRRGSAQSSSVGESTRSTGLSSGNVTSPPASERGQPSPMLASASKHMGISPSHGALDDIGRMTGYNISVFGINIDLTKYVSKEKWQEREQMSWKFFLQNLHQKPHDRFTKPPPDASFPVSHDECKMAVDKYMERMNAWYPVIPRAQLDSAVEKIYSYTDPDDARLEPADVCRIHGVLALVKLQAWSDLSLWPSPNGSCSPEKARREAFAHYVFVLKHFPYLLQNHSLDTLQAAVLLCQILHQFPHPGAVWMMTHWSMAIAIDMNLHRSVHSLSREDRRNISQDDQEQRKRIFGAISLMRIMSCGSIARPIELRFEDYDIEIPEAINDLVDGSRFTLPDQRCSFRVGIEFMKLAELYRETYNDIYALRPTADYAERLETISRRHEDWRRRLPVSLQSRDGQLSRHDMQGNEYDYFAETLAVLDAKLTLTLRHPGLWKRPRDAASRVPLDVNALEETLSMNLAASKKILASTGRLREMKSMDVTWSATTTYIAAIFTLLWVYLSGDLIETQLEDLYHHLCLGIGILKDIGRMLGTEEQLAGAIQKVIGRWHEVTRTPIAGWKAFNCRPAIPAGRGSVASLHRTDSTRSSMQAGVRTGDTDMPDLPPMDPRRASTDGRKESEGDVGPKEGVRPPPVRRRISKNGVEETFLDWEMFTNEFGDQKLYDDSGSDRA